MTQPGALAPMDSFYSPQWHRVARLKPRLRAQVRVQRRAWRGQRWYMLSDDATGRQHLLNQAGYQFVGRCDGEHEVQAIWEATLRVHGDAAPTQPEVVQLLMQLDELELLQCERGAHTDVLFRRRDERQQQRRRLMLNPFAFRLPLGDPSRWLHRFDPLARWLFNPVAGWAWLALMAWAALLAISNAKALEAHAAQQLLGARSLALAWVCFPIVKALHEFGHALAVRRWGGDVHEAGIALLLLVPAPYVDASAAASFTRRRQRAIVGAAGIAVELALAALALLFWLAAEPGLARDAAFVVMVLCGVSTVVFNGNPLLRFDGYHVACDLLDLPNLAPRSNAWWQALLRRHVLGSLVETPRPGLGERKWLAVYAPLSLAYRVALSLFIVLWLGGKALLLGAAAAAYLGISMLVMPLARMARLALAAADPGWQRVRVRLGLAAMIVVPGLLLFVLPVRLCTLAPAVVRLPEHAQVRPQVDGFVSALPMADGARVQPGDLLLRLENPLLEAARDQLASRLEGLRADQYRLLAGDRTGVRDLADQIAATEAELARAQDRVAALEVRAEVAGTLTMPRQADLLGRFTPRGATLGHVLAPAELHVRAVVSQDDVELVRHRTRAAEVSLADAPERARSAMVVAHTPAATHELPSAALGDRSGGRYPTDPADERGQRSLEPVFLVDLRLAQGSLERAGGRAWVRFDHGSEPLGAQALRRATQLFLKHFDPSR